MTRNRLDQDVPPRRVRGRVSARPSRRGAAPSVVFFLGSDSDVPAVEPALAVLDRFGVSNDLRIASAHRTPETVRTLVQHYEAGGTRIFVCAAGMAAHLAGAVAAITTKPVIGIPLAAGALSGFDALLSTVQMPPGVPVATVAVGSPGALNAAHLALRILALLDDDLAARLLVQRSDTAADIARKDEALRERRKSAAPRP
jgi:phosphoribosylaminoimidazole carboxylase PurE protein